MKIQNKKGGNERRILTAMVVNDSVLAKISDKYENQLFKSRWANIVAKWCVDFYKQYDKAPKSAIESLFEDWAEEQSDKKTVELVENFLSSISNEYENIDKDLNPDHVIDVAKKHFNKVRIERLVEELEEELGSGKIESASTKLQNFSEIEIGQSEAIDVLNDESAIREAFSENQRPLINYSGDLGTFFGNHLQRDGFISFMAPEKRGKSWWLIDVAWRAMLERKRVAFFAVGDMSKNQMMRRFMSRVSRQPIKKEKYKIPKKILFSKQGVRTAKTIKRSKKPLSWRRSRKAARRLIETKTKTKDTLLKLSVHPNSSLSVKGIEAILDSWERNEGWKADVIVVDYFDILDLPGTDDLRHRTNEAWKQGRALATKKDALVVTATQSDSDSYSKDVLGQKNFSEDKRKIAHVTGMVGINQNDTEKMEQIQRLNWIVLREGDFSSNQCVYVANCLAIANPALVSRFRPRKSAKKNGKRSVSR